MNQQDGKTLGMSQFAYEPAVLQQQNELAKRFSSQIVSPSKPSITASDLLLEANDIVKGDRQTTHGDKERSFELIAQFWTSYLSGREGLPLGAPVRAIDVAQLMVLQKIARGVAGRAIRDHFVDQVGYAAIAGELAINKS